MKIKTMQGLLLAGSLIGGVSYAHAVAVPTEVRAESPEVTWMTVNLETAGTLGVELLYKTDNLSDITHLRVTGPLNTKDWSTISNLTSIVELDLSGASSASAGMPASTFFNRTSLRHITLPGDLPSIGIDGFRESGIAEIILPASVKTLGERAFMACESLVSAEVGGAETIPVSCFTLCKNLQTVKLHEGVKAIENSAFQNCTALNSVSLPEGLISIGNNAFQYSSALKEIIIPNSVTRIFSYAFDHSGLTKIDLGDGPISIDAHVLTSCNDLEEIILPGGVFSYLNFANSCPAIKRVICRAATSPAMQNAFDRVDLSAIEVLVPDFSIVSYKLDPFWGKTGSIKGGATSDSWFIGSDLDLLSGHRMEGTPSVAIIEGGKLNVLGSDPMPMEKFSVRNNLASKEFGQFINAAALMTANSSELSFYAYPNRWYFISFPCDVKLSEITHSESRDFIFRSYDGESRALNGTGASWKDVPAEGTLEAGKGYIFQTQGAGYLTAPLSQAAGAQLMSAADRTIEVKAWNAETAENQGWNFIGNPYPSYYDMYASSLSTPITVWDGSKYVAYSLADDDVILEPMQGFFMQQADIDGEISFGRTGCQFTTELSRQSVAKSLGGRSIYNLSLLDAQGKEDHTRIVINPSASEEYEINCDATKFFGEGTLPELYSFAGTTPMAINERPLASGEVKLGFKVPMAGEYTLTMTSAEEKAELYDALLDRSVSFGSGATYRFNSEAGTHDNRFTLRLPKEITTGIGEMENATAILVSGVAGGISVTAPAGLEVNVYTADGRQIAARTAGTEATVIAVEPGLYVVRIGETSFKCIVK